MTTQVTFTADDALKEAALQKAKQDGITLKALFTFCMKAYVTGKIHTGIVSGEEPEIEEMKVTPKIQKKMDAIADIL